MDELLREYLPILIFLAIAIVMAGAMIAAAYVIARQRPDPEKVSAYECGFEGREGAGEGFSDSGSGKRLPASARVGAGISPESRRAASKMR